MATSYGFHLEALFEYAEATSYYLREASARVADRFVASVESAITTVVADPTQWRVVEEPVIRRYVFSFSFRHLLSLGAAAQTRHHLCRHALQPGARLLASPHPMRLVTNRFEFAF